MLSAVLVPLIALLPHQQQCYDAVLNSYMDEERIISFQMATGSGKTHFIYPPLYNI